MIENFTQLMDYDGFEFQVEATYTPAERGRKGDYGVPMEPDTPALYELNDV